MDRALKLLALVIVSSGCAASGARTPDKLRETYVAALEADDPKLAYALLDPSVRSTVPYADFEARWRRDTAERAAALRAARSLDEDQRRAIHHGTTVHRGGRTLSWAEVDGRYVVTSGLPGIPQTQTPTQAVRALVAALRQTDFRAVRALLSDDLETAFAEDWQSRVTAIEEALERVDPVRVSDDETRAELPYGRGKAIRLERTERGWQIASLE